MCVGACKYVFGQTDGRSCRGSDGHAHRAATAARRLARQLSNMHDQRVRDACRGPALAQLGHACL